MQPLALALLSLPVLCFGYAYVGYPVILRMLAARRSPRRRYADPAVWPLITITLPCYNEERRLRDSLDSLLAADYPADRRQLLVVSDASTDATDDIAREYASRGVELLRLPRRSGKTAAENAALAAARGAIVINVDASVRVLPDAIKALVRAFEDPTVGVASSRDVSVGDELREGNQGESGYVGYEMKVRALETRLDSIVGASGSFFGIRRGIHEPGFPEALSRDFASALMAREHGLRAVSVDEAVCLVPRTTSLRTEFRRKVRTMARGLETLWYKRHLMNPLRHGRFAWMLFSHKLCRWLVYLTLPLALVGLVMLAIAWPPAWWLVALAGAGILLGVIGMRWPEGRRVPALFAIPGFILASNVAGVLAWAQVLRRQRTPLWEPTRRPA
ncbi:MAG TPA: glycosyltransferase [Gemmatimonadaceae bacterium]|nr:glycosyltransferase [Gemmatimonadaceae bacterium]